MHTITARLDNVTNELYRSHLSLIKDLVPEMGRNFKARVQQLGSDAYHQSIRAFCFRDAARDFCQRERQRLLRHLRDDGTDDPGERERDVARQRQRFALDVRAAVALEEAPVGVEVPHEAVLLAGRLRLSPAGFPRPQSRSMRVLRMRLCARSAAG